MPQVKRPSFSLKIQVFTLVMSTGDADLPPGTSPLSKLDLGPFEVHSMV